MLIDNASSLVTDLGKNAAVRHRQLWIEAGPLPTIFLIHLLPISIIGPPTYFWVAIGPNLVVRDGKVVTSPDERAKHDKSIRDRFAPDSYLEPVLKKHRPSESRPRSVPTGIPSSLTYKLITRKNS